MANVLREDDLQIIRRLQLDIAIEVKRICDKHNINYTLIGGTLIGAVRHQGFIPWDDDLDIAMQHSDYAKFLKCAAQELDDKYEIVNLETNEKCVLIFTKIMIKNTVMLETHYKDTDISWGVFIDIFPMDNIADNKLKRIVQVSKCYFWQKQIMLKGGYDFKNERVKNWVYKFLQRVIFSKKERLIKGYRKNELKYNATTTKYVAVFFGDYTRPFREKLPADMFDEYTTLEFEGVEFSVIKEYEKYLKRNYGDYMSLPPVEDRVPAHNVEKLDLSAFGGRKVEI